MKRQLVKSLVSFGMGITMLSTTVLGVAPPAATAESEPVYLGTEAEYATTLETMFDENGLRKVTIGFNSEDGVLNEQEGLVNKYGEFVAHPVYDEIKLYGHHSAFGDGGTTTMPLNFIGGYTQVVRDGKMGLMNIHGEEVIPCQYDFVQLPSEGVAAVYNDKEEGWHYLGYWNLEQNREIIAPNQYVTNYAGVLLSGADIEDSKKPSGDYLSVHDFMDGHALVITDVTEKYEYMATIIDKNGREVLPQAYMIDNALLAYSYDTYPQKAQYLSFLEPKNFSDYRFTKLYGEWGSEKHAQITQRYREGYATGLAGPSGIMIPATYTTGVLATPGEAEFYISPATFEIILDKQLILTKKDALEGYLYGGAYGVIDFSGNTVVPFAHDVNGDVIYEEEAQVFSGTGPVTYNMQGEKISNLTQGYFTHGYAIGKRSTFNTTVGEHEHNYYYVRTDGTAVVNITEQFDLDPFAPVEMRGVSKDGLAWIKHNRLGKWGLIDMQGNIVLPFEYDAVNQGLNDATWIKAENPYAIVSKNGKNGIINGAGKQVVPFEYDTIQLINGASQLEVVQVQKNNKVGVLDTATYKLLLPIAYDQVGAFAGYGQKNADHFAMNVYYVIDNDKISLVDANGKAVYTAPKTRKQDRSASFSEATEGLYSNASGHLDNRGRIIIPSELYKAENLEIGSSYTIYSEGGNVYRVSANYLDSTHGFKTYTPGQTTSIQKPVGYTLTSYEQIRYDAHQEALEKASGNQYQKDPVHEEPFVKLISTPDKNTYKVGETFERAGFEAIWIDIYDRVTDISEAITLSIDGKEIDEGYVFTKAGKQTITCSYKGETLNYFAVSVIGNDAKYLEDGDYYIQILDKYVVSVNGWLELSDQKPEEPFTLKQTYVDPNGYFMYSIGYDGGYVYQPSTRDGDQLQVAGGSTPHHWRIAKYSNFYTIRDGGNQRMLVNASGESSANGTPIIIWGTQGAAPQHAKVTFIPAN